MTAALLLAAALNAAPPQGGVLPGEVAAYDHLLAAQARAADKAFTGSVCDEAQVEVISITPTQVSDRPGLIAWHEKVRVTGCGHSAIENANVGRFGGDPPWQIATGLPGVSIADMTLQRSTLAPAVAQAKIGLSADCQTVSLRDVYLAAKQGDVELYAPGVPPTHVGAGHPAVELPAAALHMVDQLSVADAWMEVWPFEVCGHDRTLGVVFIPLKDHQSTMHIFLPIWQQIEAHGQRAGPVAVSPGE